MNTKNYNNNVFCIAPWIHMHVEPSGDIQLCCASNYKHEHRKSLGNLNTNNPEEIWNNSTYKNVRKSMLDNQKLNDFCSPCYDRENGNINQTERQRLNKEFSVYIPDVKNTLFDGTYEKLELRYLDIRFNNLCNLKCRTCGPDWSTSWAEELGVEKTLLYNNNWEKLIPYLDKVKKIYFAGGEPLMTLEHYDFLQEIIKNNANEIELLYTSNFTRLSLKNRHVFDYWPHFKKVNAIASLDNYGIYAEYIRSNCNYDEVIKNYLTVKNENKNNKNIFCAITSVFSLYNATRLGDFIIHLFEENIINDMNQIVFNILVNPDYQMAIIMPDNALKKSLKNISKGIDYLEKNNISSEKLKQTASYLKNNHKYNKELFIKFVNYNLSLDKLRGTNFYNLYPEYRLEE